MMDDAKRNSPSMIELLVCLIATAIAVLAMLAVARATHLPTHPLWLDECLTRLISSDASFAHAMSAIDAGVETNPPTLYLMLWPIGKLIGGWSALGLRIVAFASMALATTGLYAIGRRCFHRLTCAVGVLAIWASPVIIDQTFEARFYGPWLAATTWYCYFSLDTPGRDRLFVRSILAILVATLHWFGAIAIGLLGLGEIVARQRDWRRYLPLALGAFALLACAPFYLGQRSGLTVKTWIEPVTFTSLRRDGIQPFFKPPLWFALLIVFCVMWWTGRAKRVTSDWRRFAPIAMLALFPPILIVFSFIVQPALLPRYMILAMIPWFLVSAALVANINRQGVGRAIVIALIPLLLIFSLTQFRNRSNEVAGWDARVQLGIDAIESSDVPVVFVRRLDQYPIVNLRPDLADRCAKLDFEDDVSPSPHTRYERDMARRVTRMYPQHRLLGVAALKQLGRFKAIAPPDFEDDLRVILRDFQIIPQSPEVFVVTRRQSTATRS